MKLAFIVVLGLVGYASAAYPFCKAQFAPSSANCAKFHFSKRSQSCMNPANCTTFYDISHLPDQSIDDHTAKMAQLITNVFENGNTVMGYAYVQNLGDKRGYTSGYIGFTSGTNDAYAVVKEYNKRTNNKNGLYQFTKKLAQISSLKFCDAGRASTNGLGKAYVNAWAKAACTDPRFVQTQLDVGHSMYLHPALKLAASVGVTSNIGKAIFYDTIIQHGWQYVEPLINIRRIMALTGPRKKNESEQSYLLRFLHTRRQLMCCYPDNVWPPSADRVSDLTNLIDTPAKWNRNKDLKKPVTLVVYGVTVKGTENLSYDSAECKHYKKPKWSLPKSKALPIPGSTGCKN